MATQIKSRTRVTDFGEVYTNEREVNAMLDLVKEEAESITSTFLEPACGNGNFLVEILNRKLMTVGRLYGADIDLYRTHMVEAVTSIYGVDIQQDNVVESRQRLIELCQKHFLESYGSSLSQGAIRALECILKRNIICGNTLTGLDCNGKPLRISEWKLNEEGMFERKDYLFADILEQRESSVQTKTKKYNWRLAA